MWCWLAAAATAAPLALDEALEEALAANLELRRARIALGLADQALVRARASFDPSLAGSLRASGANAPNNDQFVGQDVLRTSATSWSAALDQPLPTGGSVALSWWESAASSNALDVIRGDTVSDTVSLSLRQPLLRGTTALAGVALARSAREDAALRWRSAVEQAMLDTSDGYWRLVSARTTLDLAVRSREIAEQSLAEAQERYDEGFAGTGDVLQVERALGAARQEEVVARAEVEAAEQALRRLLGRSVAEVEPIEPTDAPARPDAVPDADSVLALARDGNAAWLLQRNAADRAHLARRVARNAALPDLSVDAGLGRSGLGATAAEARQQALGGTYNDWSVGASVAVPLPGRALRADLAAASLEAADAELALAAAEQDLVLQVQEAVRQAERDRLRVALAGDTVRYAQLALEADQELLREGKGATRNVVDSLEALDRETAAELAALIDLQRSLLELKRVAGTLVDPGLHTSSPGGPGADG
ncbi:MAG: TolC family protein [Myxococcota bacterium]